MILKALFGFFLISISLSAAEPKAMCLNFYSYARSGKKKTPLISKGYIFNSQSTLRNHTNPLNRHRGTYSMLDPEAQKTENLTKLTIDDGDLSIPLISQKVSFRNKDFLIYEAGESQFLPLNDIYEKAITDFLAASAPHRPLGFEVSAHEELADEIAAITSIRNAALKTVKDQLKDDVDSQMGKYTNYNFYRLAQWSWNHELKTNGDNDVYAVLDQTASMNPDTGVLENKVLATVQVSYPTRRSFPQDYMLTTFTDVKLGMDPIGSYRYQDLPTVKAWWQGISIADRNKIAELAGNEPMAEIGRYLNAENVPMPVMAKMLLTAFEKMEKRGIKTVFAFGSERNVEAFVRFYKFTLIKDFQYEVYHPMFNLPPEFGLGVVMKMDSENYKEMIEKLRRLAGIK